MPLLNIWDVFMIVGIVQGLVMAIVLGLKLNLHISSRFLAVIFLSLAFGALVNFISEHPPTEMTWVFRWFRKYLGIYPIMLLGPSLLFFVQSQVNKEFIFDARKKRHYWAFLFNLLPTMIWLIAWVADKVDLPFWSDTGINSFLEAFYTYGDVAFWLHVLAYTRITQQFLRQQKVQPSLRLFQINRAMQLFLAVWFPFLAIYISPYNQVLDALGYYPIFIPLTVLIYWLGFQWFFYLYKSARPVQKLDQDNHQLVYQLKQAMEKGLYLDAELTVKSAAQNLEVPQRALSTCINQYFDLSFNEFVNGYRVRAVKQKLGDPKYDHFTMAAIAHDSGFKSIATFQRVFKQMEGVSPSTMKKQLVNS